MEGAGALESRNNIESLNPNTYFELLITLYLYYKSERTVGVPESLR